MAGLGGVDGVSRLPDYHRGDNGGGPSLKGEKTANNVGTGSLQVEGAGSPSRRGLHRADSSSRLMGSSDEARTRQPNRSFVSRILGLFRGGRRSRAREARQQQSMAPTSQPEARTPAQLMESTFKANYNPLLPNADKLQAFFQDHLIPELAEKSGQDIDALQAQMGSRDGANQLLAAASDHGLLNSATLQTMQGHVGLIYAPKSEPTPKPKPQSFSQNEVAAQVRRDGAGETVRQLNDKLGAKGKMSEKYFQLAAQVSLASGEASSQVKSELTQVILDGIDNLREQGAINEATSDFLVQEAAKLLR